MLALQCNPKIRQLRLIEVPVPKIEDPDQVLIKVSYAGLCGTDLHILSGEFTNCPSEFVTIGHEFSGVVEAVGSQAAKTFQPGDRVGVDPNRPCYKCKFCRRGQVHHCITGGPHDGIGIFRNGGMANYCLAPGDQVHKLPDNVTLEQGALCEPLSCIINGWNRLNITTSLSAGARVLVIGGGIIGNLWAAILHHHGYRNVTLSEPSQQRRDITKGLDTGYSVISPAELEDQESKLNSDLDGYDVIVETSGFPPALEKAVGYTARGATILVFGCAPANKPIQLCPEEVFRKELTILGSLINPHTYSASLSLAEAMGGRYLDYKKLGIGQYNLQDYEEAIGTLKQGNISKAIFKIN